MHPRRLTAFLLGIWLAGGMLMVLLAASDNWQADQLVDQPNPSFAVERHLVGENNARLLFHYQAGEERLRRFELWEMAQILLGALFFLFLLFGTSESKVAVGASLLLLVLVIVQRLILFPNVAALARLVDFVPPAAAAPDRSKLAVMTGFYMTAEVAKWVIQLAMAGRLIFAHRRMESESIRNYVNPIDKANYRHINR